MAWQAMACMNALPRAPLAYLVWLVALLAPLLSDHGKVAHNLPRCAHVALANAASKRLLKSLDAVLDSSTGKPAEGVEVRLQKHYPVGEDALTFEPLAFGCV